MGNSYLYGYGLEWIFIIVSIGITLASQAYINSKYKQTKQIMTKRGLKGKDVARTILNENGLRNVEVVETTGILSDHYDPRGKVVRLSPDIYNDSSIASVSVAAHECGHAIQDKNGYFFLRFRNAIVPLVNLSSKLGYVAIVIGLLLGAIGFLWFGIILEFVILFFQIITLPVEFDASRKGLKELQRINATDDDEISDCKGMLTAAALTYVASVATALLQILRLLLMISGRGRRRGLRTAQARSQRSQFRRTHRAPSRAHGARRHQGGGYPHHGKTAGRAEKAGAVRRGHRHCG